MINRRVTNCRATQTSRGKLSRDKMSEIHFIYHIPMFHSFQKSVEIRRLSATHESRPSSGGHRTLARTLSIICAVLLVAYLPSMVAMLCKSVVDWLKYEGHGTMGWTDNEGGVKLETIIPWLMIPTNLNSAGL